MHVRLSRFAGLDPREQAVATAGPARTPVVDHYEVVVHKEAASGSPAG